MNDARLKLIALASALVIIVFGGSVYLSARPPAPSPTPGPLPASPLPAATSIPAVPSTSPVPGASPTVNWNTKSDTESHFLGTVSSKKVTFTSETPLRDVSLRVVPELVPYLSVSPDHLASVPANTTTTITIFFAATPNQSLGTFSGTIHLIKDNSTVARPLPVVLTVAKDTTPPILSILSPAGNSTVSSSVIVVTGTVQDETPVSVTVNGVPAQINNNRFVANEVPLQLGSSAILLTATDATGNTSTQTVHVMNSSPFRPISIDAFPRSGVAPLDVRFSAHPRLRGFIRSIGIDFDGDGVIDFSATQLDGLIHTYPSEGIFQAIVTAQDNLGNVVRDSVGINVHPMPPLREIWSGMRMALLRGDIEGALSYFNPSVRESYRQIFTTDADRLPAFAQALPDGNGIQFESLSNNSATFQIIQQKTVNGIQRTVLSPLRFVLSVEGQWRIADF